ncbi:MAG: hypothetical protein QXV38_01810, partial [Conexivisphaerales archaeon]
DFDITWLSTNRLCGEQNECPSAVISFCRIDTFTPRFELKNFDRTAIPIYPHKFYVFFLLFEPVRTFGADPCSLDTSGNGECIIGGR